MASQEHSVEDDPSVNLDDLKNSKINMKVKQNHLMDALSKNIMKINRVAK